MISYRHVIPTGLGFAGGDVLLETCPPSELGIVVNADKTLERN
jgi:hypothetical protein